MIVVDVRKCRDRDQQEEVGRMVEVVLLVLWYSHTHSHFRVLTVTAFFSFPSDSRA